MIFAANSSESHFMIGIKLNCFLYGHINLNQCQFFNQNKIPVYSEILLMT